MTAVKNVILICDGCGFEAMFQTSSAPDARQRARAAGWVYHSGRDICKACQDDIPQTVTAGGWVFMAGDRDPRSKCEVPITEEWITETFNNKKPGG